MNNLMKRAGKRSPIKTSAKKRVSLKRSRTPFAEKRTTPVTRAPKRERGSFRTEASAKRTPSFEGRTPSRSLSRFARSRGRSSIEFTPATAAAYNRDNPKPAHFGRPSHNTKRGGGKMTSSRGGKKGFRGTYIDERLFINKASKTTEIEAYKPKHVFADFGVDPMLAMNLEKKGYIKPSPIQDQAIPVALEGKDVIGIAATGTGKTAAFLIPLINKLCADRNQKVMILTPTRELALQVQKEFFDFSVGMKLFSVTCVGGSPIYPQMKQLSLGVHVVVGTPGRVKDLIARGKIKMAHYHSIVLDEADRMLDMGFIDDMKEILSLMPKEKQGLFFSATFNDKVKVLCNQFLRNPTVISLKTRDTSGSVDQDVVRVARKDQKIEHLHEILTKKNATKVLIFREMKRSVDELTNELQERGIRVLGLHGDMRNRERERAVQALKEGKVQAIIATDVAARGIHISDISHVINYDIPNDYETYIHRIGRTGRGEAKGIALTFVS